jgi:hypothetical protein
MQGMLMMSHKTPNPKRLWVALVGLTTLKLRHRHSTGHAVAMKNEER